AHMLMSLKVRSTRLITNNPKKIQQLTDYGIRVSDRIPHVMEPNEYNRFYLETKASKSGHMIHFPAREHLQEQSDEPLMDGMTPMPWSVRNE
ncbi:MAG: GTP cyclohydrolase II, partial [Chloroflexota bacterium]